MTDEEREAPATADDHEADRAARPRDARDATAERQPAASAADSDERALQILVSEFQFVAGMIPFYRRVETIALGGLGLVLSGVVGALAGLEGNDPPNRAAEGTLLSVGAWAPALLLLIEIVALVRLQRASDYIARHLQCLAKSLTGRPEMLIWELAPSAHLFERLAEARDQIGDRRGLQGRRMQDQTGDQRGLRRRAVVRIRKLLLSDRLAKVFVSSSPLIITIALVSVVFAVSGAIIHPAVLTIVSGTLAVVFTGAIATYGVAFTWAHEMRKPVSRVAQQDM